MTNEERISIKSDVVSITSRSPKGILVRAQTALSSLSKPVDSWGVSDVPVLSPRHIVPRRSQPSPSRSVRDLDSRKIEDGPSKFILAADASSRVGPIRPLSISSVSTFGAWMPDRVYATDDTAHKYTNMRPIEIVSRRKPGPTPDRQAMGAPVGQNQYPHSVTEASLYSNPNVHSSSDPDSHLHPLRMHPSTLSSLYSSPAKAVHNQDVLTHAQTSSAPQSSGITLPEDKAASKSSYDDSSGQLQRPVFTRVDVNTANRCAKSDGFELNATASTRNKGKQIVAAFPKDISVPRDVGYVEALRRWYEEKEVAAKERF
ncbi:uncharacterized protein EKO05_0002714 [Ascochyta rabiei]|uniref:Uncharacterized protein n=1 Tax=Didymella rabiei TaxID=5454 RepID=A0A163KDJ7_DIDRA|nr:uncharacterized protein EKO05_0002714 [Ascochyta rabiei]KZM26931.1 hypothetical protein ST47_g1930 [Ascochyta rabiei]UPX12147.1 hypothetical protein EKO05_0002714 [Ascochyta rabiei]